MPGYPRSSSLSSQAGPPSARRRLEAFRTGIRQCFPRLKPAPLRLVSGAHRGWNTETCFLGEDLVFQVPLNEEGHRCFELQRRLLPRLAPTLPVSIPDFSFYEPWCPALSAPLAGYRRIHGGRLSAARLGRMSRQARLLLAAQLGGFLSALQDFPAAAAQELGVRHEIPDRIRWLANAVETRVREHLPVRLHGRVKALLSSLLEAAENPAGFLLLAHSDLVQGHLFLDSQERLAGVIDWGNVTLAEPAAELANLVFFFGRELAEKISEHCPLPSETVGKAVGVYVPALPLGWLVHAVDTGNPKLFQSALARLSEGGT